MEYKKILIVGDSGRGKSTFAKKLSEKTGLPLYSTDDFFYIKKFTIENDKQKSVEQIREVYLKDAWIVEGTTRRLISDGIKEADIIFCFKFKSLASQYYFIIRRHFGRPHERLYDLFNLLKGVTLKRLGFKNQSESLKEMLEPYQSKVKIIHDFKDADKYLD